MSGTTVKGSSPISRPTPALIQRALGHRSAAFDPAKERDRLLATHRAGVPRRHPPGVPICDPDGAEESQEGTTHRGKATRNKRKYEDGYGGGVGQPRDGNPKPSYAIYDREENSVERHRVSYDIQATQRKMEETGLPRRLIDRLDHGV